MSFVSDWEPGWGYPAVVDAERPEPSSNGGTNGGEAPPPDADATPPPPSDAPEAPGSAQAAVPPEGTAADDVPSPPGYEAVAATDDLDPEVPPPEPDGPPTPPVEAGETEPTAVEAPQAAVVEAPPAEPAASVAPSDAPALPTEAAPEQTAPEQPAPVQPAAEERAPDRSEGTRAPLPPPSPRRPLPRTLAIANQKGGVGKTTTAVNLGAGLADLGYRVLVVDLDPQGNATTGLGINARNLGSSVYDVLLSDAPLEDCVEPTSVRNLFVVPATIDLAGAEIELVPAFSRELKLRRAVDRLDGDFDFTLIDCPPSLGLLTVNGLAAAGEVLVPIQCEYYALEGLGQLMRNIQLVQSNLNPRLELTTIVLTMFDARTKLADQVAREVRSHFGSRVCRTIVPRTVRLSEAPSFGQPIIVFDPSSRGAIAYRELAKEVSGGAPGRTG